MTEAINGRGRVRYEPWVGAKREISEDAAVVNESGDLGVQVAELRSDVRHVQKDMVDIKTDVRDLRTDLREFKERTEKRFDEIKDSLSSAKLWAFGLYVALAGTLLYGVARSAKWL